MYRGEGTVGLESRRVGGGGLYGGWGLCCR